jgi:YggT family protein
MISNALIVLFRVMNFLVLIKVILSWLPVGKGNVFIYFIYQVTEPVLAPIRKIIQNSSVGGNMMVDFSPIILILLINYLIIPLLARLPF